MSRLTHAVAASLLSMSFYCAASFAQPATTSVSGDDVAATVPAEGEVVALQAIITGVEGSVQVRAAEDQPWKAATVGMAVDQNAEFRTGIRSAVRIEIPPDQIITLDRLGTIKLLKAVEENGIVKTNVGMKYGRTRYDIEAAGREHEASISSPSSTLAIRGTKVSLYDQRPFLPQAVSLTGRAQFRDAKKQIAFGNKGQGKTTVSTNEDSAAALSLVQAIVDPTVVLARTDSEAGVVQNLLSSGSTVFIDQQTNIKIIRGGTPPTDDQLIPTLPGQLNFVIRWTGNSDVNLGVTRTGPEGGAGEFLYPVAGFDLTSSGGHIAFDHQGGPNGGIEIVYFDKSLDGLYGIGATLVSGQATDATVDVFLNGQRFDIFLDPGSPPVKTARIRVEPNGIAEQTAGGLVDINVGVLIDPTNPPVQPESNAAVAQVKAPKPEKKIERVEKSERRGRTNSGRNRQ